MVKHFLQFLKAILSFVNLIHEPFIFITSVLPSLLQFLLCVPLPPARFIIFSYVVTILGLFNCWVHVVFHMYMYEANPEWIVLNWTLSAGAPPWKKLFFSLRSYWPLVSLHVWQDHVELPLSTISCQPVLSLCWSGSGNHMLIFCGHIV